MRRIACAAAAAWALAALPAAAQPFIPAAGTGAVKATVRLYRADHAFPANTFGTTTTRRNSTEEDRQLRISAIYGLGGNWALNLQLRADDLRSTRRGVTRSTSGLQNQYIGVSRGLRQTPTFADAITLYVATPTLTKSRPRDPTLGIDRFALEALYSVGWAGRFAERPVFASVSLGPWVYPDTGVTQLRTYAVAGIQVLPKVSLSGSLFLARTLIGNRPLLASNPTNAEFYDLLRGGVELQYALTKTLRPVFGYQRNLAGRRIRAGDRFTVGLSWRF